MRGPDVTTFAVSAVNKHQFSSVTTELELVFEIP